MLSRTFAFSPSLLSSSYFLILNVHVNLDVGNEGRKKEGGWRRDQLLKMAIVATGKKIVRMDKMD